MFLLGSVERGGKAHANHELPSTTASLLPPIPRGCCMGTATYGRFLGALERGSVVPAARSRRDPRRCTSKVHLAPGRRDDRRFPSRRSRTFLDAPTAERREPLDRIRLAQRVIQTAGI